MSHTKVSVCWRLLFEITKDFLLIFNNQIQCLIFNKISDKNKTTIEIIWGIFGDI